MLEMLNRNGVSVRTGVFGFPDTAVPHGSRNEIFRKFRLDPESLASDMMKLLARADRVVRPYTG